MTIDTVQQGQALCQALALGALFGLLYDLFRILRVRVKLPVVGPLLDLVFWLVATGTLFLWSQGAWGGQIRFYGALFCMAGGGVYFWVISPWFLKLGYFMADIVTFLLGILTFPLALGRAVLKKSENLRKIPFFPREMV